MNRLDQRTKSIRLFAILYPFVTAAVAVNLFMLGLGLQYLHIAALSPATALALAVPLGFPATWLTTRWILGLIAEADGQPKEE